jgi:hypothetical protein
MLHIILLTVITYTCAALQLSTLCCSIDVRISHQQSRPPLGGAMAGWTLAGMSTSPFAGEVADATVEFGELLGSGSFGRVYKARWEAQPACTCNTLTALLW